MEGLASFNPQMLYPGERKSGTHSRRGWVGRPTRSLDTMSTELSRYYCTVLGIKKSGMMKGACSSNNSNSVVASLFSHPHYSI
jgi:hypothetical protein